MYQGERTQSQIDLLCQEFRKACGGLPVTRTWQVGNMLSWWTDSEIFGWSPMVSANQRSCDDQFAGPIGFSILTQYLTNPNREFPLFAYHVINYNASFITTTYIYIYDEMMWYNMYIPLFRHLPIFCQVFTNNFSHSSEGRSDLSLPGARSQPGATGLSHWRGWSTTTLDVERTMHSEPKKLERYRQVKYITILQGFLLF